MQTVSAEFTSRTQASIRKLSAACLMAFDRQPTAATRYFTVGVSSVGGPDPIAPSRDASAITEWDKYVYQNYSSRIMGLEVTHEMDLLGSLTMGMADYDLQNTDDLFTPGVDVTIGDFVARSRRPVKLAAGFGPATIPLFTGLTEKAPKLSETKKTADFHAIDFIKAISEIKLTEAVMYEDYRIDQAISALLIDHAGLAADQFVLDPGMRVVPFIYFKKDTSLGEAIRKLCESELARFFEDEAGILRLWNRQHTNYAPFTTPAWTFDRDNCREIEYPDADNVINSVEVKSNVRAVQANQSLWVLDNAVKVLPGQSVEIFADFRDDYGDLPVTTVDTPAYITSATTSYYATNIAEDGSGAAANSFLTLTASSKFATGYKMTFTNTNTVIMYITQLELFARPAKVISEIYHLKQDAASIAQYDEQPLEIENDYIQKEVFAKTLAQIIIADYSDPSQVRQIEVTRGVPQLQCGDLVNFDDGNGNDTYTVVKKTTSVGKKGLVQNLTLVQRTVQNYFTVGVSFVGGTDVIAP